MFILEFLDNHKIIYYPIRIQRTTTTTTTM